MYLIYLDFTDNTVSIEMLSDNEEISLLKEANKNKDIPKGDSANDKIAKQYLTLNGYNLDKVKYMFTCECPDIYVEDDLIYTKE